MKRYLYLLPITLLAVTFVSAFIDYNYVIVGNISGYSIISNLLYVYYFTLSNKFCIFTRLSPIGLLFINIFDIVGYLFCGYDFYNFWYIVITTSIVATLSLLFYIKNKLYK